MKYLSILFIIIFPQILMGQNLDSIFNSKPKNAIYAELGGNAIFYGINYERSLVKVGKFAFATSLGYGFSSTRIGSFNNIVIPVEVKVFNGISKKNHLEIGLGITYYYDNYTSEEIVKRLTVPFSRHKYWCVGRIGYRYTGNNGFLFRMGFTPLYRKNADPLVMPFASLSFGYIF